MKVLFIGGTGNISTPVSELAIEKGMELYLLNRGKTQTKPVPKGAKTLTADIKNPDEVKKAIGDMTFDCVVNWITFTPDEIERDVEYFRGKTAQYIFISSASAYQSPPTDPFITESTPLQNPYWQYSRDKTACEDRLMRFYREEGFPGIIVRPSHTYDTVIPIAVGNWDYSIAERMKRGKKIIVHGDGTSLWVLTHSRDFAKGFVGLIGNARAVGNDFHITSDEVLTWNQVYQIVADALGVNVEFIHIPTEYIGKYDQFTYDNLMGDKAASVIFDNSKIKHFVPGYEATISFADGIRETLKWFDEDDSRKTVDEAGEKWMDQCVADYEKALEAAGK